MTKTVSSYWKEACGLFQWQSLKLLLRASLNLWHKALVTLVKEWWLLLSIIIIAKGYVLTRFCSLCMDPRMAPSFVLSGWLSCITLSLSSFIIFFLGILSLRPSIEPKTKSYFYLYGKLWWQVLLLSFFTPSAFILGSFPIIAALFFFDSSSSAEGWANALLNALKLCIFFFPVSFFISLLNMGSGILRIFSVLFSWLCQQQVTSSTAYLLILGSFFATVGIIASLFFYALCTAFYIKIKHTYPTLFHNNA